MQVLTRVSLVTKSSDHINISGDTAKHFAVSKRCVEVHTASDYPRLDQRLVMKYMADQIKFTIFTSLLCYT